jgi:hypothetical protein
MHPRLIRRAAISVVLTLLPVTAFDAMAGAHARPTHYARPCKTTGIDPTRKAVHVIRGKPKKLKKPENPGRLFGKTRPDRQKEDQERNFGEIVLISGYSATVVSAGFVQTVGEFEDAGYMKISVKICNRDEEAQAYGSIDWRLQTPGGQVIDPGFVVSAPTLTPRADLVEGGEVAGDVYFEIDGQRGDFYIIYKPDSFDASRGIWKVTA